MAVLFMQKGFFKMAKPQRVNVEQMGSFRSPAGHILAGEVIARFLLRLSRHRRVMRIAGRFALRRAEERS